MPKGRTHEYSIWRACERFGILPPDMNSSWNGNCPYKQSLLIGYDQIRGIEESNEHYDMLTSLLKAAFGAKGS